MNSGNIGRKSDNSWLVNLIKATTMPRVSTSRKKSKPSVASPIPEVQVVVPPPPKAVVPATAPNPGKVGGPKRPVAAREHPKSRDTAGKATRADIRREVTRRVPSRLSPQQAKHKGPAPGSRASKPKRSK